MRNERQWCLRKIGMVLPLRMRVILLENKRMLVTGKVQFWTAIHKPGRVYITQDNPAPKKMLSMGVYASKQYFSFFINKSWTPTKTQQRMTASSESIGWRMSQSCCCATGMKGKCRLTNVSIMLLHYWYEGKVPLISLGAWPPLTWMVVVGLADLFQNGACIIFKWSFPHPVEMP